MKKLVEDFIYEKWEKEINQRDMRLFGEKLREIVIDHGQGVAILVAHQHGLKVNHIFLDKVKDENNNETPKDEQAIIHQVPERSYKFMHVPVRQFRNDTKYLKELGIMDKSPDPSG